MRRTSSVLNALASAGLLTMTLSGCGAPSMGKQVSYIAATNANDGVMGTVARTDLTTRTDLGAKASGYRFADDYPPTYNDVVLLGGSAEKICVRFEMEDLPHNLTGELVNPYFEKLKSQPLLFVGAFASLDELEGDKPWPAPNARAEINGAGSEGWGNEKYVKSNGEIGTHTSLRTVKFTACVPTPPITPTSKYLVLTFPRFQPSTGDEVGARRIVVWAITDGAAAEVKSAD